MRRVYKTLDANGMGTASGGGWVGADEGATLVQGPCVLQGLPQMIGAGKVRDSQGCYLISHTVTQSHSGSLIQECAASLTKQALHRGK